MSRKPACLPALRDGLMLGPAPPVPTTGIEEFERCRFRDEVGCRGTGTIGSISQAFEHFGPDHTTPGPGN